VQVGYATPWNIDIALGARNIFEKKPPAGSDGHGYIASLHHDLLGRFVYGEISYAF
jgi:outer membrane receptor protein involved in Fe transport